MTTGIIKWYDKSSTEFAIIECSDSNKLIILDTASLKIPDNYLKTGDKISFKVRLGPFGPIAKEIVKIRQMIRYDLYLEIPEVR